MEEHGSSHFVTVYPSNQLVNEQLCVLGSSQVPDNQSWLVNCIAGPGKLTYLSSLASTVFKGENSMDTVVLFFRLYTTLSGWVCESGFYDPFSNWGYIESMRWYDDDDDDEQPCHWDTMPCSSRRVTRDLLRALWDKPIPHATAATYAWVVW